MDKFQPSWTEIKSFEKDGVVITINQSNHEKTKYYSYSVQFISYAGRPTRHHSVGFEKKNNKIEIISYADKVADLIVDVEDYIKEQLQSDLDARLLKETATEDVSSREG